MLDYNDVIDKVRPKQKTDISRPYIHCHVIGITLIIYDYHFMKDHKTLQTKVHFICSHGSLSSQKTNIWYKSNGVFLA